ncbi:hypothetical protein [Streptomyces sp. 7-21]|uniref:hypothetical protein n=1 Tax=Streptomyces sp. 7-21 TaxID=2802283 RepID=UPI00191E0A22|nr:hypothetical protein [Streptomyces sp. 7-21]MBL1065254.1 hypothetical protein [Streptomyces sp. 7-21]
MVAYALVGFAGTALGLVWGLASLTRGWVPPRERRKVRRPAVYGLSVLAGAGTVGCLSVMALLVPDGPWQTPLTASYGFLLAAVVLRLIAMTGPRRPAPGPGAGPGGRP